MKVVNSHNDWDPLEETMLGFPDNACIPPDEPAYQAKIRASYRPIYEPGPRTDESIRKAKIQFDNFARVLEFQCNVKVRRPEILDYRENVKTPFWEVPNQNGAECPRDTLLVLGNEIIEAPMSWRGRFFEFMSYRKLLNQLMEEDPDMLWTMAPKPTMADSMYDFDYPWDTESEERKKAIFDFRYVTNETEPIFDAADVLRLGKDLIVQHNFNTNRKGIEWLRRHTKSRGYRVHEIHFPGETIPCHTDAILVHVAPPTNERKGKLIMCTDRKIPEAEMNKIFRGSNFEVVDAPPPNSRKMPVLCQSSAWLSINILFVAPDRCIIEETEIPTINFLESLGIKCVRVPYRDAYEFGGGVHCATGDIRRRGECLDYFPNLA